MAGAPARSGLNSTTERELVWWLAQGLGKEEAARRAGLPSSGRLYHYTRTKQFAADLREALNDRLSIELAPKAVGILDAIMSDEKVNPRVRVDAAKAVLDRSGYVAVTPKPSDTGAGFENLTIDELEQRIALLTKEVQLEEQRRAATAKVVGASPVPEDWAL